MRQLTRRLDRLERQAEPTPAEDARLERLSVLELEELSAALEAGAPAPPAILAALAERTEAYCPDCDFALGVRRLTPAIAFYCNAMRCRMRDLERRLRALEQAEASAATVPMTVVVELPYNGRDDLPGPLPIHVGAVLVYDPAHLAHVSKIEPR